MLPFCGCSRFNRYVLSFFAGVAGNKSVKAADFGCVTKKKPNFQSVLLGLLSLGAKALVALEWPRSCPIHSKKDTNTLALVSVLYISYCIWYSYST